MNLQIAQSAKARCRPRGTLMPSSLQSANEQLIGKTPFEFMPEKEAERVGQIFGQAVHERTAFTSLQHKALCKSGKVILLECSGRPITNTDGTLQGYRGIDRDISKRGEN